jgi:hypothetical protein
MNQEDEKERLNHFWEELDETKIDYLDKQFQNIAPNLLHFLVISLLSEKDLPLGTYMNGAIVEYDIYNRDKRLSLMLSEGGQFILEFQIDDFDGESHEYTFPIIDANLNIIPPGLKNIMEEVAKSQKERTVFIKSILD